MEKQTQLAAIMFTDIVGYTRLMGTSEEKALEVLQQNRAVQKPLITKHNGKFIKELGDGTMASFSKASDAVRCAMAMQQAAQDHPDLNLRIGIHMGEVLFEDGDVFGDTVNIAARIESAGKAGAVYISGSVYGAVHNKDDIETKFVEQMQLKNVNRPIDIYEVAVDGVFQSDKSEPRLQSQKKPSNRRKPAIIGLLAVAIVSALLWFTLGGELFKPKLQSASIAVLPFHNMSSDAENEFFSDGITEDLLTQLSKLKNLRVISRTSVMHFKNSELSIPEIAKELGVEYIVEGSVRKANNQVAITAQLIHAEDDGHIWAENYQRSLDDVFAIQQEVATEIASRLNLQISASEQQGLKQSETESLEAYQLCLKGKEAADDRSEAGIRRSISLFQRAIEKDPNYVTAKAELAYSILLLDHFVYDRKADSLQQKAKQILDEAMLQDSTNANIYITFSDYYSRNPHEDISLIKKRRWAAERAVAHGPNNAYAYFKQYQNLSDAGQYQEALLAQAKAVELDPFSATINTNYLLALTDAGQINEAKAYYNTHKHLMIASMTTARLYFRSVIATTRFHQWEVAIEIARDLAQLEIENENLKYLWWSSGSAYRLDPDPSLYVDVFKRFVTEQGFGLVQYAECLYKAGRLAELEKVLQTGPYSNTENADKRLFAEMIVAYMNSDYRKAEKILEQIDPTYSNRYYCWTQIGREAETRAALKNDTTIISYDKAFIFAGLGEIDSALYHFEKVDDWQKVARSRFDPDMKPLWSEPRYQAKVASYNFPPLVGDNVYNK